MFKAIVLCGLIALTYGQINRCENVSDNTFITDFGSCDGFLLCNDGKGLKGKCPTGYYFNERIGACDYPVQVTCNTCPINGVKVLSDPYHCERFIVCVNGIIQAFECPIGKYWNINTLTCDEQRNVNCINK